jgi:hypothetical protein
MSVVARINDDEFVFRNEFDERKKEEKLRVIIQASAASHSCLTAAAPDQLK